MSEPLAGEEFLAAAPLVALVLDAGSGQVRYVGPRAGRHLGYDSDAWYAPDFWSDAIVPDDQGAVSEARARLAAVGGEHSIDYRMEHADGRIVWTNEVLRAATGADARTLVGYLIDITDRKGQELLLWRNEERLRGTLRSAPDALVMTDQEGSILDMNDHAEALFGYARADVIGSSFDHLVPPGLRGRLAGLRAAFHRDPERGSVLDGHTFAIERSDGSEVPVEIGMSLVPGEGARRQILCSVRDLTARRRVEAQRRAAHGGREPSARPDASLAQEMAGPLSAIAANARAAQEMLASTPPRVPEAREAIEDIAADARRAGRAIESLEP